MVECLICSQPMRSNGERNYRRSIYWWWCDECEFGQVDPMPPEEEILEYYASGEYRQDEGLKHEETAHGDYDGEPGEWNYHEEGERGRGWLDYVDFPVRSHLDVGASTGKVLEVIGAEFQAGVEPGQWRERYDSYIRIEDVEEYFDLVTCLHTLEHVVDPMKLLRQIHDIATGQVCVEVPQPVMRMWPHLTDWREKSLLKAMDLAGLPARIVENAHHIKAKCELS